VLNEVLFDSFGKAGSDGSWQWVEMRAKRQLKTSGWKLEDSSGQLLYSLPSLSLSSGDIVTVLLGPFDPELENLDPAYGPIVLTSGQAFGDHLGVSQGGVRLLKRNVVIDEIYWGLAQSQIPFFDLSFGTGSPLREAESIGRARNSAYTGQASDWAVAGGQNSNGIRVQRTRSLPTVLKKCRDPSRRSQKRQLVSPIRKSNRITNC
jgi:hypothetical protein